MTRTASRALGAVLAVLLAAGLLLLQPVSARAHGGPIQIVLAPDGLGGVSLHAQYVKDGHLVEEILDPLVTANASDGRTAGPVSLVSSSEGVGRWVSEQPFLDEGDWTVTVRTTTPDVAEAVVQMTVAPLEAPIVAAAEQPAAAAPASQDGSGAMGFAAAGVAAGVLFVGGVVTAIVVRRRARDRVA